MTTVYDVPADKLIARVATHLKTEKKITPPEWSKYAKTGIHREFPPVEGDWWYTRVAAVMRKVYINSPVGINSLASMFGGSRDRGAKPNKARRGSRAIIRESLHQLEALGYVAHPDKKGRIITPQGQKLLDNMAHEILKEMVEKQPELGKY